MTTPNSKPQKWADLAYGDQDSMHGAKSVRGSNFILDGPQVFTRGMES